MYVWYLNLVPDIFMRQSQRLSPLKSTSLSLQYLEPYIVSLFHKYSNYVSYSPLVIKQKQNKL